MKRLTVFAVVAVLGAGCSDRGVMDVPPQQNAQPSAIIASPPGNPGLTVMTWNVYYGTDPKMVLADPENGPRSLWALLDTTNFPERAAALAQLIATKNPHLVGLQEVGWWRFQPEGDVFFGGTTPATETKYDFLALLLAALEAQGLSYKVGAVDVSTDAEFPMITGMDESTGLPITTDIRLTDRDVVLVRSDVPYTAEAHGVYEASIDVSFQTPFTTITVNIREGWSSVVATLLGSSIRFVSTHLEIQDLEPWGNSVQVAQAKELLHDVLGDETLPTILVGDFNSDVASGVSDLTEAYDTITADGFHDAWLRPLQGPPGFTCCQSDNLLNPRSTLSQRVDFVFTRNLTVLRPAATLTTWWGVVGDKIFDRTPSGLWPSDHGGVVATFLVPPPAPSAAVSAQ